MKILGSFLLTVLISTNAMAVVGGVRGNDASLPASIRAMSAGVIEFQILKNTKTPCTGIHLGGGLILTDAHCFDGSPRNVGIYSNLGENIPYVELGSNFFDSYDVSYSPLAAQGSENLGFGVHDLMLVRANSQATVDQFKDIPAAKIPTQFSLKDYVSFFTMGYGAGTVGPQADVLSVKVEEFSVTKDYYDASPELIAAEKYLLGARANLGEPHVMKGDSGAPLFGVKASGEAELIGLLFFGNFLGEQPIIMGFTRTTSEMVQNWLKEEVVAHSKKFVTNLNPKLFCSEVF